VEILSSKQVLNLKEFSFVHQINQSFFSFWRTRYLSMNTEWYK